MTNMTETDSDITRDEIVITKGYEKERKEGGIREKRRL